MSDTGVPKWSRCLRFDQHKTGAQAKLSAYSAGGKTKMSDCYGSLSFYCQFQRVTSNSPKRRNEYVAVMLQIQKLQSRLSFDVNSSHKFIMCWWAYFSKILTSKYHEYSFWRLRIVVLPTLSYYFVITQLLVYNVKYPCFKTLCTRLLHLLLSWKQRFT